MSWRCQAGIAFATPGTLIKVWPAAAVPLALIRVWTLGGCHFVWISLLFVFGLAAASN